MKPTLPSVPIRSGRLLMLLALSACGCAARFESWDGSMTAAEPKSAARFPSPEAPVFTNREADNPTAVAFESGQPAPIPSKPAPGRKVVYTATLKIVVTTAEPMLVKARELTEAAGGYVQAQTGNRIVLRVPADKFRELIEAVEALGTVTDRSIHADDVTDRYVDLQARLRNAKASDARLRELLAKAKDVQETLAVEKELRRLGEEIERIEGQLQLLEKQVALSTLTVDFSPKATVPGELEPLVRLPFDWIRQMELKTLIEAGRRNR